MVTGVTSFLLQRYNAPLKHTFPWQQRSRCPLKARDLVYLPYTNSNISHPFSGCRYAKRLGRWASGHDSTCSLLGINRRRSELPNSKIFHVSSLLNISMQYIIAPAFGRCGGTCSRCQVNPATRLIVQQFRMSFPTVAIWPD